VLRQLQTGVEKQIRAPNGAMHMGVIFRPRKFALLHGIFEDNQLYSSLYRLPLQNGKRPGGSARNCSGH